MDYLTIAGGDVTAEIEVKKSRFIAVVRRVNDEDEAAVLVDEQRRAEHAARHHCSAFVIGPDQALTRSSDDGEPSGTAGAPILGVLLGQGLTDVAAVVTRYFGGTLLGAGGLVRAYSAAVTQALQQATPVRRRQRQLFCTHVAHEHAGHLESLLRGRGAVIGEVSYAEDVTLRFDADPDSADNLQGLIASETSGRSRLETIGYRWVDS